MVVGLVVAATLLLAQTVPAQVERAIINAHVRGYTGVAERMSLAGILPGSRGAVADIAALDEFVAENLLGHDTVRIKIWSPAGMVVYSDERSLIGTSAPPEPVFAEALAGVAVVDHREASPEENGTEAGLPPVWEFHVPIPGPDGRPVGVIEVSHLEASFAETADSVWRYVTLSSVAGAVLLAVALLAVMVAQGRRALEQQQRAETMFGNLVRARAEERAHIVGALHDDIGQRLYRIHFGLQDLLSRTNDGLADDVGAVDQLVLEVEASLRDELKSLRNGASDQLRLDTALHELAEVTEAESALNVVVDVDPACTRGNGTGRIALFRATREAIVNVRKHADASNATIVVRKKSRRVFVTVTDDGIGSPGDEGVGLAVARERIEALGGGLNVKAEPRRGTRVQVWLPADVCEGSS